MLKEKVADALNAQIVKEMYSSNLYLSMASWAERNGYPGTSQWMYAQADEERMHMLKLIEYVNERGGKATIPACEMPPSEFDSVLDLFKKTYEHECFISESINDIIGVTYEERDFTTQQWMQWFVNEQIEEEAQVTTILDKLNLLGETKNLYFFDRDIFSDRGSTTSSAQQ